MTTGDGQPARWREGWRAVLPAFATAKALTVVAVVLAVEHSLAPLTWASLRDAFTHWDAVSYLDIAGHGYPPRLDYHDAFLPGYPLFVKGASLLTRDLVSAGVLASALAELAALLFVHELVRRERDRSMALYCTLVWLMAVSLTFWRSVPRYDLALFPAIIVVADVTARVRATRPLLVVASAALLGWGAFAFAQGQWVG